MKIAHWTITNNSGMHHVAASLMKAELLAGMHSCLVDPQGPQSGYDIAEDADVHVIHTHFPDAMRKRISKPLRLVWVAHGSVEHSFQSSVEATSNKGYGAGDGWMLNQYWLQHADAAVTFWDRQAAIWQSLCDKNMTVRLIPMGVEKTFWKPVESRGKYLGDVSLFTAENCHYMKWPLDLFIAWPWVWPEVPGSFLHVAYLPNNLHRWFFPLINRNGAAFHSVVSGIYFSPEELRNAFCSTDYFIGLVRYGDFNRLCLEANASGAKTISYRGNPYSDYWISEGDQREMAKELVAILKGDVEPRQKETVPDIGATATAMIQVYQEIL